MPVWIYPIALWRLFKRALHWRKPQGLKRVEKPLDFRIGETAYIGNPPYTDEQEVRDIICQVILGNPSDRPRTVTTFYLEVKSKAPYLQSEARVSDKGRSYLVPAGGGFSTVPRKPWLTVPVELAGGGNVSGWIGFCLMQRRDLTFVEAWNMDGNLVAVQADGSELRVPFPAWSLPREDTS